MIFDVNLAFKSLSLVQHNEVKKKASTMESRI